jgi:glycosyltransferase involved in cell wall biosynthesis
VRIVCVDNGAIVARGNARLVNRMSARFFRELAERFPGLRVAQAVVEESAFEPLGSEDLRAAPGLAVVELPWRSGGAWRRATNYLRALPRVLRAVWQADFVYLFLPGRLPALFGLAARLLRRPFGVYLRGEIGGREERWTLPHARFVLAANDGLRARAALHCRDTALIRPMIEFGVGDVVRDRAHRRAPPWRLLFVGRVEERKGVGELLDAAALLRARGVDFELRLVGGAAEGAERERLRERAARAGLEPAVFRGVAQGREELAAHYRWADVLVLPTHTEGFARVLWEAMVFGLPVLTTFVGGIPSVLRDGVDALRLPLRDPRGLADAVQRALEDPALRERIAAAATQRILDTLTSRTESHAELAERKLRAQNWK